MKTETMKRITTGACVLLLVITLVMLLGAYMTPPAGADEPATSTCPTPALVDEQPETWSLSVKLQEARYDLLAAEAKIGRQADTIARLRKRLAR